MTQTLAKNIHKAIKKLILTQELRKLLDDESDKENRYLLLQISKDNWRKIDEIPEEPTINDHHAAIKDYCAVFKMQWTEDEKTVCEALKKAHDRLIEIAKTPYAEAL
jgi:hypothetical protein